MYGNLYELASHASQNFLGVLISSLIHVIHQSISSQTRISKVPIINNYRAGEGSNNGNKLHHLSLHCYFFIYLKSNISLYPKLLLFLINDQWTKQSWLIAKICKCPSNNILVTLDFCMTLSESIVELGSDCCNFLCRSCSGLTLTMPLNVN